MIDILLSSHLIIWHIFSVFLTFFELVKPREIFSKEVKKREKYLPYFFRDWTITIYSVEKPDSVTPKQDTH